MEPSSCVARTKLPSVDSGSSGGVHVCRYCGKSFMRRSYLLCHMAAHRSPALECDACHQQFGRVDSLRRHRCPAAVNVAASESTDDDSTEMICHRHCCPRCDKSYSRRATLLQHVVQHHQELLTDDSGIDAHPCSVCRRVFVSALSLHNHQLVIHGGLTSLHASDAGRCQSVDIKRHLCPTAAQQQQQQQDEAVERAKMPSDSHTDETVSSQQQCADETREVPVKKCSTKCELCGRTYSGSGWLRRHVITAHSCSNEVSQQQASACRVCPVCGKSLSSVGNLNKHLLTHTARRETCIACGRQFHQPAALRQHLRQVHAPPGSFAIQCPTCGLRMRSRNSLYAHAARFHTAAVSLGHVCGICGRAFHHRGNLRKHERTHRGTDALYMCRDCPRRLRSAERLKWHEQMWHNKQQGARLTCADCGRGFVHTTHLRRHIAFRHSNNNNKTYRCCYCGVCCRHYQVQCSSTLLHFVLRSKLFGELLFF